MKLRDLTAPHFPIRDVNREYVQPLLQPSDATALNRKLTAQEVRRQQSATKAGLWVRVVALAVIALLYAGFGFTIGGSIITATLTLFVLTPKRMTVYTSAYLTWLHTHFMGVGVFALLATPVIFLAVAQRDVWLMFIAALLLISLVLTAIISASILILTPKSNTHSNDGDTYEPTPADLIAEKLPAVLVDIYAPPANFNRPNPLRSEFANPEQYEQALTDRSAAIYAERLAYVEQFILQVENDPTTEGVVLVGLSVPFGKTDEQIVKMAPSISAQLHAYGVEPYDYDPRDGFVGLRINTVDIPTPMKQIENKVTDTDFFTSNPSNKLTSYTAGIHADGAIARLPLAHTLVLGATGAGKGSVFRGITAHIAPYIRDGLVRAYVVDPKNGEAKAFKKAQNLFARIETESEAMADVVDEVYDVMKTRQGKNDEWEVSPENPLIVLLADELYSLLIDKIFITRKDEARNNMTTAAKLLQILAQGRSDRVFVVAATQNATKATLGTLRDNFTVRILLRTENMTSAAGYFLGLEDTSKIARVAPSSAGNNYRTAGIGYVMLEGQEEASLIRFGFMDNEAFADLADEYSDVHIGQPSAIATEIREQPPHLNRHTDDDFDEALANL